MPLERWLVCMGGTALLPGGHQPHGHQPQADSETGGVLQSWLILLRFHALKLYTRMLAIIHDA
jgi:hypothetical protein